MESKKTYSEQLKDPRWQKKRLEILSRDNWKCVQCGNSELTLHVHHREYNFNKKPWEYEDINFATLCETCHKSEHGCVVGDGYAMNDAKTFIDMNPKYKRHLTLINNHKGCWYIITNPETDYRIIFELIFDILCYDTIPYVYFTIDGIESEEWYLPDMLRGKTIPLSGGGYFNYNNIDSEYDSDEDFSEKTNIEQELRNAENTI